MENDIYFSCESERILPNPMLPLSRKWQGPLYAEFSKQAQRVPNRPAVIHENLSLSYKELERLSNQLAHFLLANQCKGKVVAIYADKNPTVIWAILAVLKAGAAYFVLGKHLSETRLRQQCEIAKPVLILCLEELMVDFPERLHALTTKVCVLASKPEDVEKQFAAYSASPPRLKCTFQQLAYLVFTSGSTGIPKGVMGTHSPPVHFFDWHIRTFNLKETDRFSMLSGIAHDVVMRDIFVPLSLGATIYVPNKGDRMLGNLGNWLQQNRITVAHLTPRLGQVLEIDNIPLVCLRYLFFGGDRLKRSLVDSLHQLAPQVTCVNFYGTTETPQAMGYFVVPRVAGALSMIPIGKGIDDVQLLVLKEDGCLAAFGEVGEIGVRTPYLSIGYLNDESLTQEQFMVNTYTGDQADRIYKTGDLGRFLPDGNVEMLGRRDHQVNLQGYRMELGEIETALDKHPNIQQSAIIAKEGAQELYLIAYVVSLSEVNDTELRSYLAQHINPKAIPRRFIQLATIPLTANGKINRKKLPEPADLIHAFILPQTQLEQAVAEAWKALLNVDKVGIHDHFFDLGGHSLITFLLISQLQENLGLNIPTGWVFEFPVLHEFCAQLENLEAEALPPIQIINRNEQLPLSFGQERLWHRFPSEYNNYRVVFRRKLIGRLNISALKKSVVELLHRHEVLRTVFPKHSGKASMVILAPEKIHLNWIELNELTAEEQEEEIKRQIGKDLSPFDLENEPAFRCSLLSLTAEKYVLNFVFHHIIMDGWSKRVFLKELFSLYRAFSAGKPSPLPPLKLQYVDYAAWQRTLNHGKLYEEHLKFWKPYLAPKFPPLLPLPYDNPTTKPWIMQTSIRTITISPQLKEAINMFCKEESITLFMFFLAILKILLLQVSGQTDIIVGAPNFGRSRKELESIIGYFIKPLVLRTDLSEDASFRTLIKRLRHTVLGAYAHQVIPFEKLVAELQPQHDLNKKPIFNVWFNMVNMVNSASRFPGIKEKQITYLNPYISFYNLAFTVRGATNPKAKLKLKFIYDKAQFNHATIVRLLGQYQQLLESSLSDPNIYLSQLKKTAKV